MSDDQCTEVGGPNGEPLRRCRLTAGHGGGHSDGSLTWLLGLEPTVTPLQERGPEPCGSTWRTFPSGHLVCTREKGHDESHSDGRSSWPQAQENYGYTNLAGASYEDLIRDLFRRVEQLEQLAQPTASCASEELRQGLGEVEKRMTRLEQAQVYGPGPHDLSALQASIANHVNQALTDLGSGLDSRFTFLTEALRAGGRDAERRHRETEGLLNRVAAQILGELKPVPSVFCGAPDNTGTLRCEKGPDHGGRHQSRNTSWPNPCEQPHPTLDVTCCMVKGHTTEHLAAYDTRYGRVRWVDGQGQYQDLGTVKDDGAQNERASASPAAVRCPAQFREGQCLGYAGHEGECSALPDPREPQLENPEEFEHTSYASLDYLNRRGVPDEPGDPFEGDGHGDTSHSV